MTTPLLRTKLYIPPPRPEWVPRPRLIEQLNAGLTRKLTLISAPAGFGKTTLLGEWVAGCGRPVAWVSLDEGDNDPPRFWAYFISALQTAHPNLGEAVLEMLQSSRPPAIEVTLAVLVNEIVERTESLVLILDDYHAIDAQPIHEALAMLIDHLPPSMHLVIATRSDPPLPLSRLRGRGQLTELRMADLRFTPDETTFFLNQAMGLGLSEEDIAALEARTEGWIVGLQMAALSLRGRDAKHIASFISSFTGSHRYVLDYLTDEVLQQQPEDVQTFLLRTAILDCLSGSLCDAVTGRDDGQEMLEHLDAANLFIVRLDDERHWYRYHHLFADLLRKRLRRTQPDLLSALHRRASEWYEKNGLIADAVSYALTAGDVERVARLVEGNTLAMVGHGELTTLVGLLDALPDELMRSRPWLCVAHAWVLTYAGQLDAVGPMLQNAEKVLDDLAERAEAQRIAGHILAIRTYTEALRGNMLRAAGLAREALEYLPEEDSTVRGLTAGLLGVVLRWSGNLVAATHALAEAIIISQAAGDSHVAADALYDLAALQFAQGQLHNAAATCRDALGLADEYARRGGRQLPVAGSVHKLMSQVLHEWNDLEAALRHAREGIELCEQWGWAEGMAFGYGALTSTLQAIGDADGAYGAIQKARQAASVISPWFDAYVAAQQARLGLAQGNLAAASRWAQESGLSVDDELNYQYVVEYSVLARVLIAQGRLDEALRLLARLLNMLEVAGAMGHVIEILALQAMVLQAQGKVEQALASLERALALAEPEGYVRSFIDGGGPMEQLLRQVAARGIAVGYVGKLLAAFEETVLPSISPVEPLSERELEVLRLLAVGLSNREIAEELVLAVGTVKKHTSNIYGKLGVRRRTEAVARARELGLL